jgi:hypothetical protein
VPKSKKNFKQNKIIFSKFFSRVFSRVFLFLCQNKKKYNKQAMSDSYDSDDYVSTSDLRSREEYKVRRDLLGGLIVIGSPEAIELGIKRIMEETKKTRKEVIEGEMVNCLQKMGGDDLGHIKFITLNYLVKTLKIDKIMTKRRLKPFYYHLVEPPNPRSMSFLLNHCQIDIQKFIDYDLRYGTPSVLKTMFMPKITEWDGAMGIWDIVDFCMKGKNGKELASNFMALKQIICKIPFWHTEQKIVWLSFYKPQPKNNRLSWLPKDMIKFVLEKVYLLHVQDTTDMVKNYQKPIQTAVGRKKAKLV